ncbi:MAG: TIGR00730 family Rossman fold protein [Bacteroidales bacterium]
MNVCVFASSSNKVDDIYKNSAHTMGRLLAIDGFTLINGAGNVGLMHLSLEGAKSVGGRTLGIIPEKLNNMNLASEYCDELIVTHDMKDRKEEMRRRSDAFITLPGGFGTLEEVLEVITLKQLNYINPAIVFLNKNGYFDNLIAMFETIYEEHFANEDFRKLYFVTDSEQDAVDYLKKYQTKSVPSKFE